MPKVALHHVPAFRNGFVNRAGCVELVPWESLRNNVLHVRDDLRLPQAARAPRKADGIPFSETGIRVAESFCI